MAYDKFGVKEVMNVTFYDLVTFKPVLYVDTLKLSNLENTAEESMARGGQGNPILLTWDYNREASFTIQDALIGFDGLALMTGNAVTSTQEIMYKRELFTSSAGGAHTLAETPTANNKVFIYTVAEGIPGGNKGTVSGTSVSGLTASTAYVAYYPYLNEDTAKSTVTITSNNFPGYYRIVGDTLIRSANTGVDEPFQLIVERAKVEPGFSLTMEAEGDPSVFDMNLKVMKPLDSTTMIKLIKYSETPVLSTATTLDTKDPSVLFLIDNLAEEVSVVAGTTAAELLASVEASDDSIQTYAITESDRSTPVTGSTALATGYILFVTAAAGGDPAEYEITVAA